MDSPEFAIACFNRAEMPYQNVVLCKGSLCSVGTEVVVGLANAFFDELIERNLHQFEIKFATLPGRVIGKTWCIAATQADATAVFEAARPDAYILSLRLRVPTMISDSTFFHIFNTPPEPSCDEPLRMDNEAKPVFSRSDLRLIRIAVERTLHRFDTNGVNKDSDAYKTWSSLAERLFGIIDASEAERRT